MKTKRLISITILCIAFTQMGGAGLAPMLSDLSLAFPSVAPYQIQLVSTLPAVFILAASILSVEVSKRVGKRKLVTLGTVLILLFGLLGCFLHSSLVLLYLWSVLLGMGVGTCNTLATVFIDSYFEGEEKLKLLGGQTFAASAGMMLMTFVGGFLVQRRWYLGYLSYLIVIPALVLSLIGLPSDKDEETGKSSDQSPDTAQTPTEYKSLAFPMMSSFMITLLYTVCVTNISMYLAENHFGNAAQAGMVMTVLSLAGGICGLIFGRLSGKIGTLKTMLLGFALLIAGYLLLYTAGAFTAAFAGAVLSGGAISFVMPGATYLAAQRNCENAPRAIAFTLMSSNLGNLVSPVLTLAAAGLFQSSLVRYRFLLSALLALPVQAVILRAAVRGEKQEIFQ